MRRCRWFRVNGEAVAWREPRRELRSRSCSDKAGEAVDRGRYWVGVDVGLSHYRCPTMNVGLAWST